MSAAVPLSTLLSWAWIAHTIEVDNAFEAASADRVGARFRISLAMWTNGLRHINEDGITVDELRARTHAGCNLGGLERWGWIFVGDSTKGRRDGYGSHRGIAGTTTLRPTKAGQYARRAWPKVVARVEERWRSRFGAAMIDELREALNPSSTMPWSPPEVHPTDGFRTTVVEGPADAEPRPLAALLGQALTAVTVAYEQEAEVSLPLAANVLRVVGAETVRLRDLPKLAGISKEAVAMADAYCNRHHLATTAERAMILSPVGRAALDEYRELSTQQDDARLRSALDAILCQTDALSEGLRPHEGGWRAANPYLAHTRRLVADPTGSLPWQPMVLHRGGWPDGS